MSKLDELIQELCPDGVEYKTLGDCCFLEKGNTPIQKAIPGEYPLVVTTEERKSSNKYQFNKPTVCIPLISSRGHGVASLNQVFYQEGKFALGNILCGATPKNPEILSASFLYHYLNYKKDTLLVPLMRGGANVSLTVDSLKRVKVPVPPIEVQQEIIGILDKFIQLNSALAAELASRKKQYEYYRDKLLTFDVYRGGTSEAVWRTLGEVCGLKAGKAIPSYEISPEQTAEYCIPCYGGNGLRGYVRQANQQGEKSLIGRQGALCGNVCYATGDYYATEHAVVVTNKGDFNDRFLYHLLVHGNLNQYKTAGAQPGLSVSRLEKITVPVPGIAIQNKIAYVLDNFDAICTDLSIGLPAEIEARQKQYEFYRDKLLTFAATGATISQHNTTQHNTTQHNTKRA